MATLTDVDKGTELGRWVCQNPKCGHVTVVRSRSTFVRPPRDPSERCSCNRCCFGLEGPHGTVKCVPAPEAKVIPFPGGAVTAAGGVP